MMKLGLLCGKIKQETKLGGKIVELLDLKEQGIDIKEQIPCHLNHDELL